MTETEITTPVPAITPVELGLFPYVLVELVPDPDDDQRVRFNFRAGGFPFPATPDHMYEILVTSADMLGKSGNVTRLPAPTEPDGSE